MKKIALFSMLLVMIFASSAVFACGGSGCDKDKDKGDQGFTNNIQYLCGGCCGGDKDKEPAPAPDTLCGGSGCDKDKDNDKEA